MIDIVKKYWKLFTLLLLVVIVFVFTFMSSTSKVSTTYDEKMSITKKTTTENEEKKEDTKTVFVDVKGSVNKPGVYELEDGKRVVDAISKAGGVTKNADTINLNLSKKLTDEMIIIVYSKTEIATYYKNNGTRNANCASLECSCPDDFNNGCIESGTKKSSSSTSKSKTSVNGKVSINSATKEELMTLSGIGEAKAEKIISYRQENGAFTNLEDIKNVSGIGDSVYNKIKDNITL